MFWRLLLIEKSHWDILKNILFVQIVKQNVIFSKLPIFLMAVAYLEFEWFLPQSIIMSIFVNAKKHFSKKC